MRYRAQLLAQGTPLGAHPTVAATFTLAFDQLRESLPAAAQLLELCTFLAADSLPVALLMVEPALLPDPLGTAAEHPLGRQQILGALYQRGLLQNDADGTARIHRLVQAIARDQLADQQATLAAAVALLAGLFPHEPWPANWNRCAQLLAHALAALTHANEHQLTTPATIDLLVCTGHYVTARGLEPDLAHELHCRALEMCKQLYGDQTDHPDTARCLNNLGSTLRALGQLKDAQDHHEQALAMRYRLYPGDHPLIARTLNSLATTIRAQGNLKRARQLDKDTLAMLRRLHDRDHPELARGLNSLASTLRALDQPKAARPLDEEALAMRRRLYGNDHPHIADSLHNLASDQRALNQPTAARALDKDALAMRRRLYHGDHPKIADSLDSLAQDQRRLGHWYAAHRLNKQAGTIRSRLSQRSEAPRRVELGVLDRLR